MNGVRRSLTKGLARQHSGNDSRRTSHGQDASSPYHMLLAAVERCDVDSVEHFLNKGLRPTTQEINMAILSAACLTGSYDVFEQLVTQGWLVFAASLSPERSAPIIYELVNLATQGGNIQIIGGLCRVGGINLAQVVERVPVKNDPSRCKLVTPLLIAAIKGDEFVVNYLLDEGVDVNFGSTKEANSPLGMATMHGHLAVVEALLESGANPHYANAKGESVYQLAAAYGHANIECLLMHEDKGEAVKLDEIDQSTMKRKINNIRKGKSHTHFSLQERGGHVDVSHLNRRINQLKNKMTNRMDGGELYTLRSQSSGEESF
ncbi:Aste57867_24572 [Aphanomyces stellatus]|uniref:Aste57867_24572 protein n=1 Tax=Aphanomyces stellatus TaxID=120398 RepID=A0A485LSP2_9STRA|nr:hypothetical protein As57867_024494 [Aphanomyces stellatus]VFU01211.1 Aste57867_24572 [Aphanomyces stellatus]